MSSRRPPLPPPPPPPPMEPLPPPPPPMESACVVQVKAKESVEPVRAPPHPIRDLNGRLGAVPAAVAVGVAARCEPSVLPTALAWALHCGWRSLRPLP